MKETVLQYGRPSPLVGILSELPAERSGDTGVLLLNSGLIHRVGPNRLYVRLARELARAGLPACRFDFAGIGDSPRRTGGGSLEESIVDQVRETMDVLEEARGIRHFLLTGICAGADAAYLAALADPRVTGIAPIDLYTYGSTRYLIAIYRRRLLDPRSWRNLLSGRSDILRLVRSAVNGLLSTRPDGDTADDGDAGAPSSTPSPESVASGLRTLLERDVRIHLIYTAHTASPAAFNYRRFFARPLAAYLDGKRFRVTHDEQSDHGFTQPTQQDRLIEHIRAWAQTAAGH